jgi:hypothetical protein
MTFGDLWKTLDWSGAEMEETSWLKENEGEETDPDFKMKFRMTLVEQAIFGEGEQKKEAQYMLHMAGVLPQIVAFLKAHNLLEESVDDRGDSAQHKAIEEASPSPAGGRVGGGE